MTKPALLTPMEIEKHIADWTGVAQNAPGPESGIAYTVISAYQTSLAVLAEVERLNKWCDGFLDANLKERAADREYQKELERERDAALASKAKLREEAEWVLNIVNGVSRGGGPIDPTDDEPEAAFDALKLALSHPAGAGAEIVADAEKWRRAVGRTHPGCNYQAITVCTRCGWSNPGLPPMMNDLFNAKVAEAARLREAADAWKELVPGMHHADVVIRIGGKEKRFEADKLIRLLAPPGEGQHGVSKPEPVWGKPDPEPCSNCRQGAYWLPYVGGDDDPHRAHWPDDDEHGWADDGCTRPKQDQGGGDAE